ncbi:MAG: DoxX family protein [Pseudomonadota bacterium]
MKRPTWQVYGLWALKGLAGLAFLAAGGAKLAGVEQMAATFEQIGAGQWFRYATGLIEVVSAVLLFVPGLQALGAGLLVCTMIGAVITHLFVIGGSAVPAVILGVAVGLIAWAHRGQLPLGAKEGAA